MPANDDASTPVNSSQPQPSTVQPPTVQPPLLNQSDLPSLPTPAASTEPEIEGSPEPEELVASTTESSTRNKATGEPIAIDDMPSWMGPVYKHLTTVFTGDDEVDLLEDWARLEKLLDGTSVSLVFDLSCAFTEFIHSAGDVGWVARTDPLLCSSGPLALAFSTSHLSTR